VATREVFDAKQELAGISDEFRRVTGVLQTRREHARARLAKAEEEQRRLQQELDRLLFTLRDAFGITLGQQTLVQPTREGPRTTFIVKTSQTGLRKRIAELRRKLREAPD